MNSKWDKGWKGTDFITLRDMFQWPLGMYNQIGQECDGENYFFGGIMIPRKELFRIIGDDDARK